MCRAIPQRLGVSTLLVAMTVSGLAVSQERDAKVGFVAGHQYRNLTAPERTAYVAGWADGVLVSALFELPEHTEAGTRLAVLSQCLTDLNNSQLEAILLKWLDDRPERWHEPVRTLLYAAMDNVCHFFPPEP